MYWLLLVYVSYCITNLNLKGLILPLKLILNPEQSPTILFDPHSICTSTAWNSGSFIYSWNVMTFSHLGS